MAHSKNCWGGQQFVPAPKTISHSLKETLIFLAFFTFFLAHPFILLRFIEISFVFILYSFLSVEDSSSVCRKLIVFLKLFTRERLYLFLIMNPGNGSSIFVTLFGKTGLNEICLRMHFNAFWMHYNAFQRSPMIRNALTTFPIDRWQFCLMFHNDFPTFFNALATFPHILILKAFPLWPGNYRHQHVRTLKIHRVLGRLQNQYVATSKFWKQSPDFR